MHHSLILKPRHDNFNYLHVQKIVFLVICRNIQGVPIELPAPGSRTLLQNMNGYGHYHGVTRRK
ncbi:unnamed protein product [Trichogramma brassicae]|uniref:Uncharacterized protein n=1 Tax=Trichogramma brassicae TaxID=86971 RepID=A0A6H5ISI6_9HYME|nr:unnamed protein product [Trichogramma brassicae]